MDKDPDGTGRVSVDISFKEASKRKVRVSTVYIFFAAALCCAYQAQPDNAATN